MPNANAPHNPDQPQATTIVQAAGGPVRLLHRPGMTREALQRAAVELDALARAAMTPWPPCSDADGAR